MGNGPKRHLNLLSRNEKCATRPNCPTERNYVKIGFAVLLRIFVAIGVRGRVGAGVGVDGRIGVSIELGVWVSVGFGSSVGVDYGVLVGVSTALRNNVCVGGIFGGVFHVGVYVVVCKVFVLVLIF